MSFYTVPVSGPVMKRPLPGIDEVCPEIKVLSCGPAIAIVKGTTVELTQRDPQQDAHNSAV